MEWKAVYGDSNLLHCGLAFSILSRRIVRHLADAWRKFRQGVWRFYGRHNNPQVQSPGICGFAFWSGSDRQRASPVSAAVDPAEGYVGKIADEVMSLANSGAKGTALRGRFASVLNRYVNLRNIANFALGPYQKKLPPGDKNEFYTLFNNYAAALFVYYVDDFKGSDLKIISTSKQGKFHNNCKCDRTEWRGPRTGQVAPCRRRVAATKSVTSMSKGCG